MSIDGLYISDGRPAPAGRIEWGIDWYAGGNPRDAGHSADDLALAEDARPGASSPVNGTAASPSH